MKHLHQLLLLTTLIICAIYPSSAIAFTYEYGGNTYDCYVKSDGTASANITKLTTPNLVVPSTVVNEYYKTINGERVLVKDKYTLTSFAFNGIGTNANDCILLKTVELPASVLSIGGFSKCTSLIKISCPNVQTIGYCAFNECTNLESIDCPNVQTIVGSAFSGCTSLGSITCPNVQIICASAFSGCKSLVNISCPNVQTIYRSAFSGCTSLENISCPNVQTIGYYAFRGCTSLKKITCPNVYTIEGYAFERCTSLERIDCPNVQSIGEWAFSGCTSLRCISFQNVQSIRTWAFTDCISLNSIYIDNVEPPVAHGTSFSSDTYSTARLYVPMSAVEKYRSTGPWSRFFHINSAMDNYIYTDFYDSEVQRNGKVRGVTADGRTQLLITSKGQSDIILTEEMTVVTTIDGESVSDQNLVGSIGDIQRLGDDEIGFVYTAPDGYYGPDNTISYTVEIELTSSDGQDRLYARVEVWRPGILLLHGLFSSADCWSDAYSYLSSSGAYNKSQILNYSYKSSNSASFKDNTHTYKVVQKSLERLNSQLKSCGIASARYDLVGHSMGGILSRMYAQEVNHNAVNRILTFNTPHSGSQFGDLGQDLRILAGHISTKIAFAHPVLRITLTMLTNLADSKLEAVYNLSTNSEAISVLNDASRMSNAQGIPVHAACTSFDGVDEEPIEPTPHVAESQFASLTLWFEGLREKVSTSGFNILNFILQDDYHDGVVPLVSQRGGLSLGNSASVLMEKYPRSGFMGNNSNAHHCKMTHWKDNHERLISLLRAQKDDPRFAKSFAPVDLSASAPRRIIAQKAEEARPESFIKITATRADSTSRLVNVRIESSDDVVNKGAFSILDGERVIVSDYEDEFTFAIPYDYDGPLEIVALGYTSYDAWVTDAAVLDFEGAVNPFYVRIESAYPMVVSEGEAVEPQVTAFWPDGGHTTVKADFELIDSDGEAEIADGLLNGVHEGSCRLVATYREMTDTIPVVVMKVMSSGIEDVEARGESCMKMFRRDAHIVVRMSEDYDGVLDFEVFDLDGHLVANNVADGSFVAGEEIMFSLPERADRFLIVRCRREDGSSVAMKIFD